MAGIWSDVSTGITNVISGMGDVVTFITSNPVVLIGFVLSVTITVVGLVRSFIRGV